MLLLPYYCDGYCLLLLFNLLISVRFPIMVINLCFSILKKIVNKWAVDFESGTSPFYVFASYLLVCVWMNLQFFIIRNFIFLSSFHVNLIFDEWKLLKIEDKKKVLKCPLQSLFFSISYLLKRIHCFNFYEKMKKLFFNTNRKIYM